MCTCFPGSAHFWVLAYVVKNLKMSQAESIAYKERWEERKRNQKEKEIKVKRQKIKKEGYGVYITE